MAMPAPGQAINPTFRHWLASVAAPSGPTFSPKPRLPEPSSYVPARFDQVRDRGGAARALDAPPRLELSINQAMMRRRRITRVGQFAWRLIKRGRRRLSCHRRRELAALDRQKAQKEAELATVNATVGKLEALIPVLNERVEIKRVLYSHDTGSKANYLELYQQLVETQQDLTIQKSRAREAEAAVAAIIQSRLQAEAEYRRDLYSDLVEAQRKAAGLKEDLVKATQRTQLQVLAAPVDGTVQQLSVHTIGGVVTAAQALMVIVPPTAGSRSRPTSTTATSVSCRSDTMRKSRSIHSTSPNMACCTARS